MKTETQEQQRLDKWLWAARFYKTRALAAEAISGGKVHLNGDRVKPSRNIRPGDHLVITRGQYVFDVTVTGLNMQRRPASEAQQLYSESQESMERREAMAESMRMLSANMPHTERRPSKKQRRQIVRFKRDR